MTTPTNSIQMPIWKPPLKLKKGPATIKTLLFLLFLFFAAFISSSWISTVSSFLSSISILFINVKFIPFVISILFFLLQSKCSITSLTQKNLIISERKTIEFQLNCTAKNQNQTCPTNYPITAGTIDDNLSECPSFFRWIHEDLRPWAATGISRDMVERAKETAHFRVIIVKGKAYVEKFRKSIQTRDVFTIWGILQLLRRYPGRLPDLELMFDCDDRPVIGAKNYGEAGPPALFRYCGDRRTMDIVFPDWSFWGW